MPFRACFLFCLILMAAIQPLRAQNGAILPYDDPVLWNYNALLTRGYLNRTDVTTFPIHESTFFADLREASAGATRLDTYLGKQSRRLFSDSLSTSGRYGIRLRPGLTLATQESADFLRPEDSPSQVWFSQVGLESWFTAGRFTAAWGWRHDRYYDRDPEGFDTAHRWAIRPENAYLSYSGAFTRVLVGRVRQHWAGYDQPGLVLSQNARPMDHLSFQLGSERLNIQTSLSELDSITGDGRFTGTAGDDSVASGSERRYLAVHRLTLAQPGSWSLGLMHSILYSGANSGLSLKFLNPFNPAILSVDEKPKNDENNGMLGAFFQAQLPSTLFQGQIALDDVDILNGKEPPSIAASLLLYRANVAANLDLTIGSTIVTARTYNADQAEGKYIYLNRGLATQNSDYFTAFIAAPFLLNTGMYVTPRLDLLFQGEADIRDPFPAHDEVPALFKGNVERTVRTSVDVRALMDPFFDVSVGLGVNFIQNEYHQKGSSGVHFSGSVMVSYRIMWSGAY